jgi:hypothetical protein
MMPMVSWLRTSMVMDIQTSSPGPQGEPPVMSTVQSNWGRPLSTYPLTHLGFSS